MSFIQGQRFCKYIGNLTVLISRNAQTKVFKQIKSHNFQYHTSSLLSQNVNPKEKSNRYDHRGTWHQQEDTRSYDKYDQESMIQEAIREKRLNTIDQIEELMSLVVTKGHYITKQNFNSHFLSVCGAEKVFEVGKLLFDHIYQSNKDVNIGVANKFLRLCYSCREKCTEEEHNVIYEIYKNLLERYEVLDSNTCENVILGLSITDKWREIADVFKLCRLTVPPSQKMYSAFITAALRNDDDNLAWELMDEAMVDNRKPTIEVYEAFLKENRMERLDEIVHWLEKYNEHIHIELANLLMRRHTELTGDRKQSSLTSVTPEGKCRKCLKYLKNVELTQEEFDSLREAFLNPVLIGNDIFLKTKPQELQKYHKFLDNMGIVDVVLDGLNIAYGSNKYGTQSYSELLRNVVQHFVRKNKKIIVLGRRHMLKWPAQQINYIRSHTGLFLIDNNSADDPYLLHAAMHSGIGTNFVSKDQMRSHKFLLKDKRLKYIFSKWQQKHQIYINHVTDDGRVYTRKPPPYLMEVHMSEDEGSWHLPIIEDTPGANPLQQVFNTTWLCLKR
ncbi:mitochondrial ribonuclease P catalytic subunit [Cimex lectularius]|uniref:Mitochondrial ribonuclease P catalytic subunit n=1 Tax=Cimex lectularius TaxID=79782 RepID=A0A8I6SDI8_CIMLE|nr:mitochondrial ribonuclease P catalytic subunit [Cimex lectularius]